MTSRFLLPLALLALAATAPAGASAAEGTEPFLVEDINTTPLREGMVAAGSYFNGGLERDGIRYFAARDRSHGNELWRSDGTEAGTWRVDDLCPGPCDADPLPVATVGGRLLFAAADGVHGAELWSTDGRPGAAEMIHEFTPGPGRAYPGFGGSGFAALVGTLYFGVGTEIWRTDGTRGGTRRVVALDGATYLLELTSAAGSLYFRADTPEHGSELWRSDGTAAGTSRIADLCGGPCSSYPRGMIGLGERLIFFAQGQAWALDVATDEIHPLATLKDFHCFESSCRVSWNGAIYFADGPRVLRTDGTPAGTGPVGRVETPIQYLTALPEALLIAGSGRIWSLTGQNEAPVPLFAGELFRTSVESPLTGAGDRVFFRVSECVGPHRCDEIRVTELWVSDGTPSGTRKVVDLCGGVASCRNEGGGDPRGAAAVGDHFLFVVDSRKTGNELWSSDGTAAGTGLLKDIWTDPGSADPDRSSIAASSDGRHAPVALGEELVFPVLHSTVEDQPWLAEHQLWSTTGGGGGAIPVGPVKDGVDGLAVLGDGVLFNQGFELWRFAGGSEPLVLLSEQAGPNGASIVQREQLYFSIGRCEDELWISDGTPGGTRLLGELPGGGCPFLPWITGIKEPMAGLENGIAFHASDGFTVSDGLWSTGPTGDIRLLAEVSIHAGDEYPGSSAMASTGSRVLFSGADLAEEEPDLGRELWTSDGSAEGTRPVVDLRPGREGSSPHDLVAFRGEVAFIASPAGIAAGESLWISDGTAPGTRKISDLAPAGGPSWAGHLTVLGERLVFVATDQRTGPELWTSDGTAAGTELVVDLRPGPRGSYPQSLAAIGDLLVFAADDGESGLEAFASDGTAAGTRRLADIAPGRDASSPSDFTLAGELLYFWADDAVHGRELWALSVAALEGPGPGGGPGGPAPEPLPGEWLTSSALPGFRAKVRITPPGLPPVAGRRVADCIVGTLCVEGALAGRPEAFLKVIGPRPNGFLWVQISRFTPSEIELWVEQTATGELRYYRLPTVGPGDPDVSGLQDRQAFRP